MLLDAPNFTNPLRTSRQDLAPNYLYLSTLSTLQLTATSNASLGNFTIGNDIQPARIFSYPGAATTLTAPSATATYASVGTLYASSVTALATAADSFTTRAIPIVQTSAYYGALSTLTATTLSNSAVFQGDLTQTDGLGLGPATLYTVGGTATFNSTVQTTTAAFYGPAVAAHSTLSLVGALTATAAFSTLGTFTTTAEARTDGLLQANQLSTISYNALATAHPSRAVIGTSNTTPYTAYVQGTAAFTAPFTATATSSLTVSTATGTYSTLTFLDGGAAKQIYGVGTALTLDGTAFAATTYSPFFSTVIASNYVDIKGEFRTSTIQVNQTNPISYNVSSPLYTLDVRGNMYVSTAFVMDNLAVYGGTNPTLYTTPTFNTLYASTNGLLINNRLFVDGIQNRVGVHNFNPAYTLDICGTLYVNSSNAFNVAGANWVVASDVALKQNIQDISSTQLTTYSALITGLPLKRFRYKQDSNYNVDISRQIIINDIPQVDGQGQPLLENATVEQTDVGFATEYRLGSAYRYGFIAQDVELFFPNSVYEIPFYKYPDFHFLTPDQVYNAQYAITRTMVSTVIGHSTVVGHRSEFISTVSQRQKNLLMDISNATGFPYNAITIGAGGKWSIGDFTPQPVTGFAVVHKDLGFDISWTASVSPGVVHRLYWKKLPSGPETMTPLGSATSYSLTGLDDLGLYRIRVTAYSAAIKMESVAVFTNETAYSWPVVIAASVTPTDTQFTFAFTGNLTGGTFVKYRIYAADGVTVLHDDITTSTFIKTTGLVAGTDYVFKVTVFTTEDTIIQESAQFTTVSTKLVIAPLRIFVDNAPSLTISNSEILNRRYLRYYLMGGGGAGGQGRYGTPWSNRTISVARNRLAAAAIQNKVIFGGGYGTAITNVVDMYDISTDTWTSTTTNPNLKLSVARYNLAAAAAGNKILFAGGDTGNSSAVVDMYDVSTNTWTSTSTNPNLKLSFARPNLAAAATGNKILFAGGDYLGGVDVVDMYDVSTDTWTSKSTNSNFKLSVGRYNLAAAAAGNKIFFAGGLTNSTTYSSVVDIYDISSESWSTTTLSVARSNLAAAAAGNKIFFAGGLINSTTRSSVVDIYDISSESWSTATLSLPRSRLAGAAVGNKILFAGGEYAANSATNIVDIYDITTNKWIIDYLNASVTSFTATRLNDKIFFAGGSASSTMRNNVNIYDKNIETTYVAGGGGGGSGQARGYLPLTNGSKTYTVEGNTPTPEYIDLSGKTFTDIQVAIGAGATPGQAQGGSTTLTIRNNTTPITIVDASGGFSGSDATDSAPGSGGAGFFGGGGGVGTNFNGSNVSGGAALGGGYTGQAPSKNDTTFVLTSGNGAGPGSSTAGGGSRTYNTSNNFNFIRTGIGGGGGGGNYLNTVPASGGVIYTTNRTASGNGTAYTGQGGGGGVQSGIAAEVSPGNGGAGFAVLEFTDQLPSGNLIE